MTRSRYDPLRATDQTRWLVLQDIFRKAIAFELLSPGTDLRVAMARRLSTLQADGWQAESGYEYGFVFIRRGYERLELVLNAVDPAAAPPIGHGANFASAPRALL